MVRTCSNRRIARLVAGLAAGDGARRGAAGNVGGERDLVEETRAGIAVDQARIDVPERIAGLAVVQVHVARDEDRAWPVAATVERHAGVIEQPVGAGADDGIGRAFTTLDRRREAVGRDVLREPGQQRALPVLSAVDRLEQADPGIGGHLEAAHRIERAGQVDGTIVVRAGEQVQRVAGGDGGVRFVLALQVGVAIREGRPGHHIDVRAGDRLLLGGQAHTNGGENGKEERRGGTVPPETAGQQIHKPFGKNRFERRRGRGCGLLQRAIFKVFFWRERASAAANWFR